MLTVACVCVCVLVLVLLSCQGPERYRRFVEMEIKHGRLSMAAFLGVVTTYSGVRFPGYLSKAEGIKFEDIPGGAISSWAALPTAAWFQIVLVISIAEAVWLKQDPAKAPGDVIPEGVAWARYPDGYDVWLGDGSTKQVGEDELILGKTWKLNAERNNGTRHSPRTSSCPPPLIGASMFWGGNHACIHLLLVLLILLFGETCSSSRLAAGRAAMMGITGMVIHEALTGNPVFPLGETL